MTIFSEVMSTEVSSWPAARRTKEDSIPVRPRCSTQRTGRCALHEDRTTSDNPYGKSSAEREEILRHVSEVEPLLRASATMEIDASVPLEDVVPILSNSPEGGCSLALPERGTSRRSGQSDSTVSTLIARVASSRHDRLPIDTSCHQRPSCRFFTVWT